MIVTKYPEIVKAAKAAGVEPAKCFAKVENVGGKTRLSYPLVKVINGKLLVTSKGIAANMGRVKAAKAYASKLHEGPAVFKAINAALDGII